MIAALWIGAGVLLGALAAGGHGWALHVFYAWLGLYLVYIVAVVLSPRERP